MLFRKIIAVYCETHTEHINTLCGQILDFLNVKAGGTCSNHPMLVVNGTVTNSTHISLLAVAATVLRNEHDHELTTASTHAANEIHAPSGRAVPQDRRSGSVLLVGS
jgi:hypothetical protein